MPVRAIPVFLHDTVALITGVTKGALRRLTVASSLQNADGSADVTVTGTRLDTSANIAQWVGSTAPSVGQKAMVASIPVAIASDQSPLSIGVQADIDAGRVFAVTSDVNMAAANTENPLVLLKNPAGSGKTLYIIKGQAGTHITNVNAAFTLYTDPTVTNNGTTLTISRRLLGSGTAPVAEAYSLPTITYLGVATSALQNGQNNNSVVFGEDYNVAIPPGHAVLLTGDPSSNNRLAVTTISWAEK